MVLLEKAMAPHSSTLAWKIPWTEEPRRLQPIGSLRVAHDWMTSLSLFTVMHWRRKWQPTPVILPGESQGRGSLVGCCLWGHTESDTTEAAWQQQQMVLSFISLGLLESRPSWLHPCKHVDGAIFKALILTEERGGVRPSSSFLYLSLSENIWQNYSSTFKS